MNLHFTAQRHTSLGTPEPPVTSATPALPALARAARYGAPDGATAAARDGASVLSTATPRAAPTCWVVLTRPEVTPATEGSTAADIARVIIAGNATPNPPIRSIVGSKFAAYDPDRGSRSSRSIPAAMGASPAAIMAGGPNRAFSRADAPTDSPAIAAAEGSMANPAAAGPQGISRRLLTLTLRNLERDGLLVRTVYPTVPARGAYTPTRCARGLHPGAA